MAAARRHQQRRRGRSSPATLALAALAALALCLCTGVARAATTTTSSTSSSNGVQQSSMFSSSTSIDGRPAVARASSSSNSAGGGPLPAPGQCVVASQNDGQACADGVCCQVRQELRLCMPSWAKLDGSAQPPPPMPRAVAAVGGGPAVPCCVMLADSQRNNVIVPFCAADPYASGQSKDAFVPLPPGSVVTKMTPQCAAGPKAPGGFKFGTVACSVAFPPGTLPQGFTAPPGDFTAKAPFVAGVAGRAYPCAAANGGSYGRLLQVASVVPAGQEGPNGEPAGTLRVTSKCE